MKLRKRKADESNGSTSQVKEKETYSDRSAGMANKNIHIFETTQLRQLNKSLFSYADVLNRQLSLNYTNVKVYMANRKENIHIRVSLQNRLKYHSKIVKLNCNETDVNRNIYLICVYNPHNLNFIESFHKIIEKVFRCFIRPLHLSEKQFNWLIGLVLKEMVNSLMASEITLTYCIPGLDKQKIDAFISKEGVRSAVLESLKVTNNDFTERLIDNININLMRTYGINFQFCAIKQLTFKYGQMSMLSSRLQINLSDNKLIELLFKCTESKGLIDNSIFIK